MYALRRVIVFSWALVLTVVVAGQANGQTVEQELANAKTHLETARSNHLHLISPGNFEKAEKSLADAQKQFEKGDKIDKIQKNLDKARMSLTECESHEEIGNIVLREALQARADALTSDAPQFATEEWNKSEEAIVKTGRRIEKGDGEKARSDADKAAELYRAAELLAIRVDLLGRIKDQRAEAVAQKAEKWAPVTLSRGDDYLAEAENILQTDRYRQSDAKKLAQQAGLEFQHAAWIAKDTAIIDKDRKELENLIHGHEARLLGVSEALGLDATFAEGFGPIADDMIAAINSLKADRADLQANVKELREKTKELDSLQAEMEPLKAMRKQVANVQAIFSKDEAEILLTDVGMVVRLFAMSFASGSSTIEPSDFATLTKVQRTLRKFPDAQARIEGHTDSQGDRNYNQALSQRRADAVRDYLLANMDRTPESLQAVGYGPSRPAADNSTAQGRAMNRRIDVLILGGGAMP